MVKTDTNVLSSLPAVAEGRKQGAALSWPSGAGRILLSVLDLNTGQNVLTGRTFHHHGPYLPDTVVLGKLAFTTF